MKRTLLLGALIGVLCSAGGAIATDYGFVPLLAGGNVRIAPTQLGVTALQLQPTQIGASLQTFNYQGSNALTVANNGELTLQDPETGRVTGGISNYGALETAQNFSPSSAAVPVGQARVWFDKTPVTGGLMVTYKDAAGVFKTVRLG